MNSVRFSGVGSTWWPRDNYVMGWNHSDVEREVRHLSLNPQRTHRRSLQHFSRHFELSSSWLLTIKNVPTEKIISSKTLAKVLCFRGQWIRIWKNMQSFNFRFQRSLFLSSISKKTDNLFLNNIFGFRDYFRLVFFKNFKVKSPMHNRRLNNAQTKTRIKSSRSKAFTT